MRDYIFKVIDYLTSCYNMIYKNRFIHKDIIDIEVNKDLYNEMIFVTLKYIKEIKVEKKLYCNSLDGILDEICNLTSEFFFWDLDGQENMVRIAGCYKSELEHFKIPLFFMRYLWIYHENSKLDWSECFITYHIIIPFFYYSSENKNMTEKEKDAHGMILQFIAKEVGLKSFNIDKIKKADSNAERQKICLEIKEKIADLRRRQEEILIPVTEPAYEIRHCYDIIHEHFAERFYAYCKQLNTPVCAESDKDE